MSLFERFNLYFSLSFPFPFFCTFGQYDQRMSILLKIETRQRKQIIIETRQTIAAEEDEIWFARKIGGTWFGKLTC